MRPLVWGLVLIVALVLQASLLPLIAFNGIKPDIMLIITMSAGLLLGREHGVGVGFFAGLLQDLASGNIFGLNVLSKTVTGYFAGLMERKVFKENILLPLLFVIAATILNSAVALFVLFVIGFKIDIAVEVANTLYLIGYNTIVAIPVHRLVFLIARNEMPDPNS